MKRGWIAATFILVAVGTTACAGVSARSDRGPSPDQLSASTTSDPTVAPEQGAPMLPKSFHATGRYVVPKLGFDVPFWWNADGQGNMRMVAGGPSYPIWFTNLIYEGTLYTYTYEWPHIDDPFPCLPGIPGVTMDSFNQLVAANAHLVGTEILLEPRRRRVQHWRLGLVAFPLPLASADIYVDEHDRRTWRQVLHFGLQNVYAPDQDEWIFLKRWSRQPGPVELPEPCRPKP